VVRRGSCVFRNDEEAAALVRRFETGELPPDDFKHAGHLTVALWHATQLAPEAALGEMRRSIHNFLARHSIDPETVYHETITAFWMKRVAAFAARADAALPFFERANALAAECADSRLIFDYFSEELIKSNEARARWVEPDMRPLDF
jgi:hypothetical protein